jgi:serine/threonine protein kinase
MDFGTKVNLVGSGTFGKVYATDKGIAVKKMFSNDEVEISESFLKEVSLLKTCRHPNIVPVLDVECSRTSFKFSMPLAKTSLWDLMGNHEVPEEKVEQWTSELFSAMHYLHLNGILHRDVKPMNILVTPEGSIQLCDFGWGKFGLDDDQRPSHTGEVIPKAYRPPELLACTSSCFGWKYHTEVDVWCGGLVVLEMMANRKLWIYMADAMESNAQYGKYLSYLFDDDLKEETKCARVFYNAHFEDYESEVLHVLELQKKPLFAKIKSAVQPYYRRSTSKDILKHFDVPELGEEEGKIPDPLDQILEDWTTVQSDVTWFMYQVNIDWMEELRKDIGLDWETSIHSIWMLYQFLSRKEGVDPEDLQGYSCGCLYLSELAHRGRSKSPMFYNAMTDDTYGSSAEILRLFIDVYETLDYNVFYKPFVIQDKAEYLKILMALSCSSLVVGHSLNEVRSTIIPAKSNTYWRKYAEENKEKYFHSILEDALQTLEKEDI